MADFTVETPNAEYSGKTLGVRFDRGVARVNEDTVPAALGRTPQEVAGLMAQEAGYTVTDAAGARVFTVPEMPWKTGPQTSDDTTANGERVQMAEAQPSAATKESGKKAGK